MEDDCNVKNPIYEVWGVAGPWKEHCVSHHWAACLNFSGVLFPYLWMGTIHHLIGCIKHNAFLILHFQQNQLIPLLKCNINLKELGFCRHQEWTVVSHSVIGTYNRPKFRGKLSSCQTYWRYWILGRTHKSPRMKKEINRHSQEDLFPYRLNYAHFSLLIAQWLQVLEVSFSQSAYAAVPFFWVRAQVIMWQPRLSVGAVCKWPGILKESVIQWAYLDWALVYMQRLRLRTGSEWEGAADLQEIEPPPCILQPRHPFPPLALVHYRFPIVQSVWESPALSRLN